jgi:hypothetical protein
MNGRTRRTAAPPPPPRAWVHPGAHAGMTDTGALEDDPRRGRAPEAHTPVLVMPTRHWRSPGHDENEETSFMSRLRTAHRYARGTRTAEPATRSTTTTLQSMGGTGTRASATDRDALEDDGPPDRVETHTHVLVMPTRHWRSPEHDENEESSFMSPDVPPTGTPEGHERPDPTHGRPTATFQSMGSSRARTGEVHGRQSAHPDSFMSPNPAPTHRILRHERTEHLLTRANSKPD